MRSAGDVLRTAGVRAIYLVHGTFAGTDATGMIRAATRLFPPLRAELERQRKQFADAILGETGNYTPAYAALLDEALSPASSTGPRIPVRLFYWSSENHHIGRAHAAVTLLDELHRLAAAHEKPGRVLLWGHSHAGNVFALLTNLLAANAETRDRFFSAARTYYRVPLIGSVDVPAWTRVREHLAAPRRPLNDWQLDMATFGTPIRYGWDSNGCANLLHIVNHRPAPQLPEFRVPFPPKVEEFTHATYGDYFQQLGIAGTNMAPAILAWRTWRADRRLGRLLQMGVRGRDLLKNLACGMRVPNDGTTLLVNYHDEGNATVEHLAGHACYTRREWMLFHITEICRRFYGLA